MRRVIGFAALPATVLVATCLVRARAAVQRWGATDDEVGRALPGDGLVPDPDVTLTRAITIRTPPERVFPWLAQLGQGRGGFYSYDWLENRAGLDIRSADHIVPGLQLLEPGDRIAVAPGPPSYGFVVADVAAPERLVLRMTIHPFTGMQIPPHAPARGWSLDATWAFALTPVAGASTRLVTRTRARLRLPLVLAQAYGAAFQAVELVMERRMLLGVRERAEAAEPRPTRS